jgi:hypothetical protein
MTGPLAAMVNPGMGGWIDMYAENRLTGSATAIGRERKCQGTRRCYEVEWVHRKMYPALEKEEQEPDLNAARAVALGRLNCKVSLATRLFPCS